MRGGRRIQATNGSLVNRTCQYEALGIIVLAASLGFFGCADRDRPGNGGTGTEPSIGADSAAVADPDSLNAPAPRTAVYACSADSDESFLVTTRVSASRAEVWLPEAFDSRNAVLTPVVAASGTRYEGEGLVLWTRGDYEALLEIDGTEYPGCVENRLESIWADARLRGVTVRAVGNEPGWLLEITDGGLLHFTYDYGERELAVPAPEPEVNEAARVATYHAEVDDGTLRVEVEDLTCTDNMSGFEFEKTVTVELGERTFYGCGRAGAGAGAS